MDMTEINYSVMLRHLVEDYFDQRLTRIEYVAQRRSLLDRIDHEFNGEVNSKSKGWPESDPSSQTSEKVSCESSSETSQNETFQEASQFESQSPPPVSVGWLDDDKNFN